jgi:hypothetical protein
VPTHEARGSSGADPFVDTKTFVQILGGGVSLYGRKFKQLAPPFVALGIAAQLVLLSLSVALVDATSDLSPAYLFLSTIVRSLSVHLPAALLAALSVVVLIDHITGARTSLSDARARIRPLVPQVLAAGLYGAVLSLLGIFLPTPIIMFPSLMLALMGPPIVVQVIAHERKTLQEALPRARSLWRRQLLRIFLYLLSIALGLTLLWLVLVLAAQGALASNGLEFSGLGEVLFALGAGALFGLSLPLMITMSTLAYIDLRARTEDDFSSTVLEQESRPGQ